MFKQYDYVTEKTTLTKGIVLKTLKKELLKVYFENGEVIDIHNSMLQKCRIYPDFSGNAASTDEAINNLVQVSQKMNILDIPDNWDKIMEQVFATVNNERDTMNRQFLGITN